MHAAGAGMTGLWRDKRAGAAIAACLLFCWGSAAMAVAELRPWKSGATPPLLLKDGRGAPHSLASLKGRVVLVNFWATWCEPCREEMPALVRLKRELGEPLEILAVNLGESPQKAEGFLASVLPPADAALIRVLYDHDMGAARRWKAGMLPASFIVGRNGRIAYTLLGEADWTAAPTLKALRALAAARP